MGMGISNDPAGVPRLRGIEKRTWVAETGGAAWLFRRVDFVAALQ
jgi:hypothetical protein